MEEAMASVLGSPELVSEIMKKFTVRKDLGRCGVVCKLWLECSQIVKASFVGDPHLVWSNPEGSGVSTLNLATRDQKHHPFPLFDRPEPPKIFRFLASCDGLMLLIVTFPNKSSFGNDLIIGDPTLGKWELLPPPPFLPAGAVLLRDDPSAESITLFIVSDYGMVARLNFQNRSWVEEHKALTRLVFDGRINDLFYHQDGFLFSFFKLAVEGEGDGVHEIYWYSMKDRKWIRVSLELKPCILMRYEGKILAVGRDHRVFELLLESEVDENGFINAGLIECPRIEEAISVILLEFGEAQVSPVVPGREELYWGSVEVPVAVKLSLKSLTGGVLEGVSRMFHHFTTDEGEAIFRVCKSAPTPLSMLVKLRAGLESFKHYFSRSHLKSG